MIEKIDSEKVRKAMVEAVIDTFENTAFIDAVPLDAIETKDFENILSIDILKPISSTIMLFISNPLKQKIIENIFSSIEVPLTENQKSDGILEILIILAGNFLMAYFNKPVEYKMELPQLVMNYNEKENGNRHNSKNRLVLNFDAEGLPFRIAFKSVRYWY
jgi:hypothetical protein